MSTWDELRADLLDDNGYCVNCGEDAEDCECGFEEFIDAALAAGYRKPRTITTVDELDALPVGSVVKGERFGVAIKEDDDSPVPWASDGAKRAESSADILSYVGTAVVLHEPEVTA